jgi:predicted GIY-YIG superfamily endonuclease
MMSFWAYMLHCRAGYFYVGHTDNLELRVAQHQTGQVPGFAADHRPVELVWSECFQTRDEAKTVEKQIKGWSRAKKMALIRGDWGEIPRLAKRKDSPSTSSGKSGVGETVIPTTDHPERVEGLPLLCHPDTVSGAVRSVAVSISRWSDGVWHFEFTVMGEVDQLRLSAPSAPLRRDGLWQTTCFEAFFLHQHGPAYLELNFSPSGEWAAYGFTRYRAAGRTDAELPQRPMTEICVKRADRISIRSAACLPDNLHPTRLALSAVIEETDGTKSYWALRHPPGAPDFHHPDCFALALEAPRPA